MKNNKGFSLVELIIVIAIMAILVGVMAPQLIKYIEKSNVSADMQMLGAIESAITYAVYDPSIALDPDSKVEIQRIVDNCVPLQSLDTSTALYDEIISSLNWPDLTQATYMPYIKSAHSSSTTDCNIYITYNHDLMNPIKIWINTTDISAGKNTSYIATSLSGDFDKTIHIN